MIFYLKNQYLPHNEEQGTFIKDIFLKQYLITEKLFQNQ